MSAEYLYALAEDFRSEARALYAKADRVLHDANLSVECREVLAAGYKSRADLAYDQSEEIETNERKRMWRAEAAA